MKKAIVFDLGGVVFSLDGGSYEGREKLAELLNLDKEKLHKIWFERKDLLIKGKMSEEEFLNELIKMSDKPLEIEYLKEVIRKNNKVNEQMINLLIELKSDNLLVALTNEIKEWNEYRISKFKLNDYFEFILASCDVGVAKPETKIYEILLDKLKLPKENIFFIDNHEENLIPAKDLGIKTHLFKNKNILVSWLKENNLY